MKFCWYCGREVQETFNICPYCGAELKKAQAQPAQEAAPREVKQDTYPQNTYAQQAAPAKKPHTPVNNNIAQRYGNFDDIASQTSTPVAPAPVPFVIPTPAAPKTEPVVAPEPETIPAPEPVQETVPQEIPYNTAASYGSQYQEQSTYQEPAQQSYQEYQQSAYQEPAAMSTEIPYSVPYTAPYVSPAPTEKPKKKKAWIWILILLGALMLIGILAEGDKSKNSSSSNSYSNTSGTNSSTVNLAEIPNVRLQNDINGIWYFDSPYTEEEANQLMESLGFFPEEYPYANYELLKWVGYLKFQNSSVAGEGRYSYGYDPVKTEEALRIFLDDLFDNLFIAIESDPDLRSMYAKDNIVDSYYGYYEDMDVEYFKEVYGDVYYDDPLLVDHLISCAMEGFPTVPYDEGEYSCTSENFEMLQDGDDAWYWIDITMNDDGTMTIIYADGTIEYARDPKQLYH